MNIYFDTSYIVKFYLTERGSDAVRHLYDQADTVASAEWGKVELLAALHRKLREKTLSSRELKALLGQIERDGQEGVFHWLEQPRDFITILAKTFHTLPGTVFIRAGDATHLLMAKLAGMGNIYSSDAHLLAASRHFGIKGLDIIPRVP